jgi:membrane protein required for colicin V production
MTAFDYSVIVVVALSVLISLFRGAVREIMALVSWIGSFLIALHLAPTLSIFLPATVKHPWGRLAVAFIVLMLVSLIVFAFLTMAMDRIVRGLKIGSWDRAFGMLFGLARALVVLVGMVLLAGMTDLPKEPAWRDAVFSEPLVGLAKNVRAFLPARVAERIRFE